MNVYLVEWVEDGARCMEAFADDITALEFASEHVAKLPKLHKLALRGAAFVRGNGIASELLAALQGVVRVADRSTVEFDAARAVIAKAGAA